MRTQERVSAANDSALRAIRSPALRAKLVSHIVDAIIDVNEGRADIILLAARRMSSLYALLRRTGLPELQQGFAVSDRFIQLLPDLAWEGSRVILLDDTRVTGATISDREASVRRLVGDTGEVSARVAMDLAAMEDDAFDSLTLHNQFAAAFGSNLTPFFTDFAVSGEFAISASEVDRLLASDGWRVVDVTNGVLAGTGSRSFSLFPAGNFLERVELAFGDASGLVDVAKIRLFIDEDFGIVRARFVPIVLTRDLVAEDVRAWLVGLGIVSRAADGWAANAAGLVAILLSRALFVVFAERLVEDFGLEVGEDHEMAEIALGPDLNTFAGTALLPTLSRIASAETSRRPEPAQFAWPEHADVGGHFTVAGDDLVRAPYERLLKLKERVIAGQASWRDDAIPLRRMTDLTGGSSVTLSIALDVLNDLGYCVPSHAVRGESVVRVYRPGEAVVEFTQLIAGALGGRLASLPETTEIPDEAYFGDAVLSETRGLAE